MSKNKWKRLKNRQFAWCHNVIAVWCVCLLVMLSLYAVFRTPKLLLGMVIMFIVGVLCIVTVLFKISKIREVSRLMEQFIRNNALYQSHYVTKAGLFRCREIESMDYYPIVDYQNKMRDNIFCIRIRMDGCLRSEKFRDLEQNLADMFCTVCTDRIEERGYLTYCFELAPQEQITIKAHKDIMTAGENEIVFSRDVSWNWKKCPHLLIIGNTGSGKTQLAQYIISCLLKQGVRVIYCDPKNDDDMRLFIQQKSAVYVTKENDIAKAVRETYEQIRLREQDLQNAGIKGADFPPVFLFFDEMIAFAKIAEKKTYEDTAKRLSAIVVTGRSKRVYAGMVLQRPDTAFIEGAIRDNLGCRIAMGQMSEAAYKMAFGSDFADIQNKRREIGSGLIFRQGIDTKPREFLSPFLEKGALSKE